MGGRGSSGAGKGGLVTLYHRTSDKAADAIVADGFRPTFRPGTNPEYVKYNSQYVFFTRKPNAQAGYGSAVVSLRVPAKYVERDPYSGQYRVRVENLPRRKPQRWTSKR